VLKHGAMTVDDEVAGRERQDLGRRPAGRSPIDRKITTWDAAGLLKHHAAEPRAVWHYSPTGAIDGSVRRLPQLTHEQFVKATLKWIGGRDALPAKFLDLEVQSFNIILERKRIRDSEALKPLYVDR